VQTWMGTHVFSYQPIRGEIRDPFELKSASNYIYKISGIF